MLVPDSINYIYIIAGGIVSLFAIIAIILKYEQGPKLPRKQIIHIVSVTVIVVFLIGTASVSLAYFTGKSSQTNKVTPTPTHQLPSTIIAASGSVTPTPSVGQDLYTHIVLGGPPNIYDTLDSKNDLYGWPGAGTPASQQMGCNFVNGKYDAWVYVNNYVNPCISSKFHSHNANFAYKVNMTVLKGSGGGLVFRASNTTYNAAMYRFSVRPSEQVFNIVVQHDNAGPGNRPCDSTGQSYCYNTAIHMSGTNTLAVIVQGIELYFYINGVFLWQIKDSTLSSGFLGLYAVDKQEATDVAFDNAEIWNLP